MNDPAACGRGLRQRFLFKSRSQCDAGPNIYVRWVYEQLNHHPYEILPPA